MCNAHHIRELEFAYDKEKQQWAKKVQDFLYETHEEVENNGGRLGYQRAKHKLKEYRALLKDAEIECPEPPKIDGKRGRTKKVKAEIS